MRSKYSLTFIVIVFVLASACAPRRENLRTQNEAMGSSSEENFSYGENEDFNLKEKNFEQDNDVNGQPAASPYQGDVVAYKKRMAAMKSIDNQSSDRIDKFDQTGIASWYGKEFHGRKTASGEAFNMNALTAAHKSLPFGTVVEVKNLENGKTVKVKINDRGPYKERRVLDLSYAAAKELGIISDGEAMIGINVIGKSQAAHGTNEYNGDVAAVAGSNEGEVFNGNESEYPDFEIQTGAFYSRKNADKLKMKLESLFTNATLVYKDGDLYKVRILGVRSKEEADRYRMILKDENISSFIVNK